MLGTIFLSNRKIFLFDRKRFAVIVLRRNGRCCRKGHIVYMREKPEVLAPAGSIKGMKAAIAAGCDAVYMGGSRFGARAYAENPEEDEMLEAIAYCHLHGVKLYMTVNTLLKSREMEDSLFSFLRPYYEAGLDAVIVQDLGVLRFISKYFPGLAVHASTQMTLTMGKGTEELAKYHVTRMVPARELTLEELSQMRKDTELELEVFVHGALCYCYSGQCLFSSMFGGRSGNRGRCAQPCRMPYHIEGEMQAEGDYLLSPMELCNLPYLPEMIEAGIDSFKIEGRMKRPEYTAFVASMYRKYIDLYFELGREGYQEYLKQHDKEWQENLRQLAELYNRSGFTQGYLEGKAGEVSNRNFEKRGEMLSSLRPKHGGVYVGEVLSVGKHEVIYQTSKKLSAQDVVEFRDQRQQPSYEYTLGSEIAAGKKVTARYQKGCRIKPGDTVYRTKDAALLARIREEYLEKEKQLPVCGVFTAALGEPVRFTVYRKGAFGETEFVAECTGDICQKAEKQPATKESVHKTLNQTGNSKFYFEELEIRLEGELFLPVGGLKKLRREALDQLEKEIVESFWRKDTLEYSQMECKEDIRPESSEKEISASVMRSEQLEPVLARADISIVYVHTEVMNTKELLENYEKIIEAGKKPWLILPHIFRKSIYAIFEKELENENGIFSVVWDGYLVKNMESLHFLMNEAGISKEKIRLDHNMYLMNQQAYEFWKEQGIEHFTLPLELTEEEMEGFTFLPQTEILVYGKLPLMVSAQCITANTTGCKGNDRVLRNRCITFVNQKKQEFEAVNYCKYCYNMIYQKEPLFIRELVEKNVKLCSVQQRYSFTTESGRETADVLEGKFEGKTQLGHFRLGIE